MEVRGNPGGDGLASQGEGTEAEPVRKGKVPAPPGLLFRLYLQVPAGDRLEWAARKRAIVDWVCAEKRRGTRQTLER